jgi:DNA-binding MarR family transcriptional regulator
MRSTKYLEQSAPPFDSLEQEAYLNLWRSYDRLRAIDGALFRSHRITAQQYNVLRILKEVEPEAIPTLELARRLISKAPDITRMLDQLEKLGLILRNRMSTNRRIVQIGISAKGSDLLVELEAPVRECNKRQLGHLEADELRRLIYLLKRAREPFESKAQSKAEPIGERSKRKSTESIESIASDDE